MSAKSQTLYVDLPDGKSAAVTIQIREATLPVPLEMPVRRAPDVEELHLTAEALVRRVYQFHSND